MKCIEGYASFWSKPWHTSKYLAWTEHLDACAVCKKAIRGRFAGATPEQMKLCCCEVGKDLYWEFIKERGKCSTQE